MTILVTGGTGQVATALAQQGAARVRLVGRPEFNFDRIETIEQAFRDADTTVVVNAAAYTAVDAAETDQDAAWCANRDGPAILALLCEQAGIPLIHISTDYVFDGQKHAPYVESDAPAPTGVYGASKLAGEVAVLGACSRTIVLRTSWVYAPGGRNFVRTMLTAARKSPRLRVVADQKGCPTAAGDLAAAILAVTAVIDTEGWQERFAGIFHAAGSGWTTWYGLAGAVFDEAARYGFARPEIEPIATADWPTPARRPPDSRLDCARLEATFGIRLPDWREALARTIAAMLG